MGRKKAGEVKKINRISEEMKKSGASNKLVAIWTNVNITTVSTWRNNTSQPSDDKLNELGELLEIHNGSLKVSPNRSKTGLAQALQNEYVWLTKEENIPFEIDFEDESSNEKSKIINPVLIEKLKAFAEKHKKTHGKIQPLFIDKIYDDISKKELKDATIFICKAGTSDQPKPYEFLVVNEALADEKFIACFTKKEDAESYVDFLLHN